MNEKTPVTLGRYVIQEEIGRGMMGAVYRAMDPDLGRIVALKTVRLAFSVSEDEREQFEHRFLTEARAAGGLSHPGIVVVHDVGRDPDTGTLFISFEFLEGQTLEQMTAGGPLEWHEAARITARIAEALHHAHRRGIVHRDVKPANIIVSSRGDPKVTDFGIAKVPMSQITMAGQFFGTPAYMSPEQAVGSSQIDGRSDLFSLGAIFYLMLTGRRAFVGASVPAIVTSVQSVDPPPPSTVVGSIPVDVDRIVACLLTKAVEKRYADGKAAAEDIEDVLADVPPRHLTSGNLSSQDDATIMTTRPPLGRPFTAGVPATKTPGHRGWLRLRRLLPIGVAAVLGTLALALGLGYWLGTSQGRPRAEPKPEAAATGSEAGKPAHQAVAARPERTGERERVWQWIDRLKPTPTPEPMAGLEIDLTHSLKSGRLRVWVDDDVALDEALQGFLKKQILLYKSRRGTLERAIDIDPGEHILRVRIDEGDGDSWNERLDASFEPGETRRLSVELGGFLRKRLKVEWERDEPTAAPREAPS